MIRQQLQPQKVYSACPKCSFFQRVFDTSLNRAENELLIEQTWIGSGNTKGGSITVQLTSCLTGLDYSVLQIKTKIVSCHTANSKPVKHEVSGTVILPPLVFPGVCHGDVISLLQFRLLSCGLILYNWVFLESEVDTFKSNSQLIYLNQDIDHYTII
jgi:hypothetical protein